MQTARRAIAAEAQAMAEAAFFPAQYEFAAICELEFRHYGPEPPNRTGAKCMARKEVLRRLREILLQRRQALIQALAGDKSLLRQMAQQSGGDEIDFAIDSANDEIFSRLAEAESRELAHIQYALEKMDEGTYGKCEACNRNIPQARLEALPYATLCIECKRKVESGVITASTNGDWSHVQDGQPTDSVRLSDLDFNG
jgi:DnaK suppressor protein